MKRFLILISVALFLLLIVGGYAQKQVVLNVWSSPDNADALQDIAQRFMQKYPNIKVQVTPISWEVLYPRMLADVASGTGAFDVATWDVMTAGAVAKGFVDLNEFRKQNPDLVDPNWDMKDFDPTIGI